MANSIGACPTARVASASTSLAVAAGLFGTRKFWAAIMRGQWKATAANRCRMIISKLVRRHTLTKLLRRAAVKVRAPAHRRRAQLAVLVHLVHRQVLLRQVRRAPSRRRPKAPTAIRATNKGLRRRRHRPAIIQDRTQTRKLVQTIIQITKIKDQIVKRITRDRQAAITITRRDLQIIKTPQITIRDPVIIKIQPIKVLQTIRVPHPTKDQQIVNHKVRTTNNLRQQPTITIPIIITTTKDRLQTIIAQTIIAQTIMEAIRDRLAVARRITNRRDPAHLEPITTKDPQQTTASSPMEIMLRTTTIRERPPTITIRIIIATIKKHRQTTIIQTTIRERLQITTIRTTRYRTTAIKHRLQTTTIRTTRHRTTTTKDRLQTTTIQIIIIIIIVTTKHHRQTTTVPITKEHLRIIIMQTTNNQLQAITMRTTKVPQPIIIRITKDQRTIRITLLITNPTITIPSVTHQLELVVFVNAKDFWEMKAIAKSSIDALTMAKMDSHDMSLLVPKALFGTKRRWRAIIHMQSRTRHALLPHQHLEQHH